MLKNTVRTLKIYETFAGVRRPMTLSELARGIGVAPSTCHALINTLRDTGYLYNIGEKREVYPTRRMLELAVDIAAHEPHVARLSQLMAELRDITRETVILGRRNRDQIVYLNVVEGPQSIRYAAKVGEHKPLHSTAIGKVVLSQLDREARMQLLRRLRRDKMTETTISNPDALNKDIEAGLVKGHQATRGENVSDVMAIAAPVTVGGSLFGICIAGPIDRMHEGEDRYAAALESIISRV